MPLYDYRCRECGHEFEIQQSISEDALTECPECSGALKKVFSPVGIAFKGSGFYKNDSRSSSGSSSGGSGSGSSGSSSTSGGDGGGSADKSTTSTSDSGSNSGSSSSGGSADTSKAS